MELLVGDGLLRCPDAGGEFCHPVLLQKLELEFYPEKKQPQFVFRKREQPPELYMEFLGVLPGVNNQQLARCADELKRAEFPPLGLQDTDGFLRRLIQGIFPSQGHIVVDDNESLQSEKLRPSSQADFSFQSQEQGRLSNPTIERRPAIFMRQRRTGPGNVFGLVLEDIANRTVFPTSLLQILGLEETPEVQPESQNDRFSFGNEG
jgi:hypothetical protein